MFSFFVFYVEYMQKNMTMKMPEEWWNIANGLWQCRQHSTSDGIAAIPQNTECQDVRFS